MIEIYIIAHVILITLGWKIEKKKDSILILYLGAWLAIGIVTALNSGKILEFNSNLYFIVCGADLCYFIGYIVCKYCVINKDINQRVRMNKDNGIRCEYHENYKVIYFLLIVSLLFNIKKAITTMVLLLNGSTWTAIRYNYNNTRIVAPVEAIINTYLVLPVSFFIVLPIALTNRRNKKVMMMACVNAALNIFATQGKEIFIYWGCALLVYYLHSKVNLSKKAKRNIIFLALTMFIVIEGVQYSRKGKFTLDFLSEYLGIQFNLMDHWMKYIDSNNLYSYGMAFFSGFINLLYAFPKLLGIIADNSFQTVIDNLSEMISKGVQTNIGGLSTTNVYITQFTFFYYDFRELGMILGNLLFGCLSGGLSKILIRKNQDPMWFSYYILVAIGVICSVIYWMPYMTAYILSFIYLRICYRKVRVS